MTKKVITTTTRLLVLVLIAAWLVAIVMWSTSSPTRHVAHAACTSVYPPAPEAATYTVCK